MYDLSYIIRNVVKIFLIDIFNNTDIKCFNPLYLYWDLEKPKEKKVFILKKIIIFVFRPYMNFWKYYRKNLVVK